MDNDPSLYFQPSISKTLKALNMHLSYHKAIGNHLFYWDKEGNEKGVLDMLGGYGSLFFGHNNPELVAIAMNHFESLKPFMAQGSIRHEAAELSALLREILYESLGENYMFSFGNTGAEAVETVLKHCRLVYANKLAVIKNNVVNPLKEISKLSVSGLNLFLQEVNARYMTKLNSEKDLQVWIRSHNEEILKRPPIILALRRAYHGKTKAVLEITYFEGFKAGLRSQFNDVVFAEPGDAAELHHIMTSNTAKVLIPVFRNGKPELMEQAYCMLAACIVEPVQGEGGIHILEQTYLEQMRELCTKNDVPLVFDEIQCGMGRTGTFLYAEQLGIKPDYILLSKSLGGGISKVSAVCIAENLYIRDFDLTHSSTFAEDDMGCAIAKQSLKMLKKEAFLMKNASERGQELIDGLKRIQEEFPGVIKEVRGIGLMIGFEFESQQNSGSACLRMLAGMDLIGFVACGFLLREYDIRILPCLSNTSTLRLEPSAYLDSIECQKVILAFRKLAEIIDKQNMHRLTGFLLGIKMKDTPVTDYKKPDIYPIKMNCDKKVAFVGHFVHVRDMVSWDEGLQAYTETELHALLLQMRPVIQPFCSETKYVKSMTGDVVELNFIGYPVSSDMMEQSMSKRNLEEERAYLQETIKLAKQMGCQVLGFGGYNSIVSNNCRALEANGLALTTGNAYTVAVGMKAMLKTAENMEMSIHDATLAVLGAGGNIGRVYAEIMSEKVNKLILIGRKNRLDGLRTLAIQIFKKLLLKKEKDSGISAMLSAYVGNKFLTHNDESAWENLFNLCEKDLSTSFPLIVTDDMNQLQSANMIIAASNASSPLIYPSMLGDFPVLICDIALPYDTDTSVHDMANVKIMHGGLVSLPNNPEYHINGINLPAGTAYACMSETLLLGLDGYHSHFSYGPITAEQVRQIEHLSFEHGFTAVMDEPKLVP